MDKLKIGQTQLDVRSSLQVTPEIENQSGYKGATGKQYQDRLERLWRAIEQASDYIQQLEK